MLVIYLFVYSRQTRKGRKLSYYYIKSLIIDIDKVKIGLLPLAIKIHTATEGSMFPNVECGELFQ